MQTGWNPEHLATQGTRGLPVTYDDKQPSLFNRVLSNFKNPFNRTPDNETIESIDIICDTLRYKVFHINSIIEITRKNKDTNTNTNPNTIKEVFDNFDYNITTQQYELANKKYEESIKRLINITKYTILNNDIYKKYIKSVHFPEDDDKSSDTTIDEKPQESLEKLIKTLRDIVNENTYIEYIINKYKRDSISKEQIYKELIEHLKNIKYSSLTINKRDETLEQSGGNNKQYKEILGKRRRIYKIKGSRKEHVKYKGELIPVSDYKKLVKK
jgi:hypothetical protein